MSEKVGHVLDRGDLRREVVKWKLLLLNDIGKQIDSAIEALLDMVEERIAAREIGEARR